MTPYPHQREALAAWQAAKGRGWWYCRPGPANAGRAAGAVLGAARRMIMVPTLDLMQQWYALLRAAFPDQEIGPDRRRLSRTTTPHHRHLRFRRPPHRTLGDRFGLLIFDEAHHHLRVLPRHRRILAGTLPTGTDRHPGARRRQGRRPARTVGPIVYRKRPEQLAGDVLADYRYDRSM